MNYVESLEEQDKILFKMRRQLHKVTDALDEFKDKPKGTEYLFLMIDFVDIYNRFEYFLGEDWKEKTKREMKELTDAMNLR